MRITIFLAILLLLPCSPCSQPVTSINIEDKMKWFEEAKLGIFIHWGIYSVNGISESWSFYNGYISHTDYMKQLDGFNAKNYDPKEWANLIAESGAKYTVITSKHHDGFALWDSKYGKLNSLESSKSKKDLLTPFVKEIRGKGLMLAALVESPEIGPIKIIHRCLANKLKRYSILDKPERWQKFLNYRDNQLMELKSRYKPDLWWFDGDWEHNAIEWKSERVENKTSKKLSKCYC